MRSLNRLLNDHDSCNIDKVGDRIFRENSCDNNDDECDWEVLVECVKTGEIDWVFVEKPVEL